MKRWPALALVAAGVTGAGHAAPARVTDGPAPVRCGAVQRPGVAMLGADGEWRGPAVELCQAVARAVSGPAASIRFRSYDDAGDLAQADQDQVAFLSSAELQLPALRTRLRPGALAVVEHQVVIVPAASPIRRGSDLAGRMVCFMIGSAAEDALDGWAAAKGIRVERLAFQEPDEMRDAYAVGKCAALAADRTEVEEDIAAAPPSRLLAEPLATLPVFAATPAASGEGWAAKLADALRSSTARQGSLATRSATPPR